jgi:hypothetical protein
MVILVSGSFNLYSQPPVPESVVACFSCTMTWMEPLWGTRVNQSFSSFLNLCANWDGVSRLLASSRESSVTHLVLVLIAFLQDAASVYCFAIGLLQNESTKMFSWKIHVT